MAITISGENNNDRITAQDGVIDTISGFNIAGIITASSFTGDLTGNVTGNLTGNVNSTSPLLLQTGGSERFRITGNNELGIAGANYGTSGQVLTSGGSGSAVSWSTINLVSDTSPQLGGNLDTNSHHIHFDNLHAIRWEAGNTPMNFQMFHESGFGMSMQNGNGSFYISNASGNNSSNILIRAKHDKESIKAIANGAVELYHNDNLRLQTWSDAVNILGDNDADAILHLYADRGDDNADKWMLRAESSVSRFSIENYSTGSWVENIRITAGNMVELKHADGTTKFQTTSTGVSVTNRITAGGDANTYMNLGPNDIIDLYTGGTNVIRMDASGRLLVNTTSTNQNVSKIVVKASSPSNAYDNHLYLEGSETSGDANTGGVLGFGGHDGGSSFRNWANILGMKENSTDGNTASYIAFHTRPNGGNPTERVRITSTGKIAMGDVSTSASSTCDPDGNQLLIRGASTVGTKNGHIMLTGDSATVGQGPQIVFSESGSGSNNAGAYIGHVRQGSNSIGDLVFGTRETSGDANTVPTERLRIDSSGRSLFSGTLGYGNIPFGGNPANAAIQIRCNSKYNGIAFGENAVSGCIGLGGAESSTAMVFVANAHPANLGGGTHDTFEWWSGNSGGGGPGKYMTLNTGGHLALTTGNLEFANGSGIDFSAVPDGGRSLQSDGNKLDDYEEGLWTPTLYYGSGTSEPSYSWRYGNYVKIGRQVTAWFNIGISGFSASYSQAYIGGLPFQADDPSGTWKYLNHMMGYSYASGWGDGGSDKHMFLAIYDNQTKMMINHEGNHLSTGNIGSGQRFSCTVTYQTDG